METKAICLSNILRGAPEKNLTIYSPLYGEMKVKSVESNNIKCYVDEDPKRRIIVFDDEGRVVNAYNGGYYDMVQRSAECLLFPSKDNRDWSTFKIDVYPDLPVTWNEYSKKFGETLKSNGGSIPYSETMKTLQKLLILRDCYRNSTKKTTMKFNVIENFKKNGTFSAELATNGRLSIFSFQEELLTEKFIANFSDMIKEVKEFL